jgi:hypothetical protein
MKNQYVSRAPYNDSEYGRFYYNPNTDRYDLPSVTTILSFWDSGSLKRTFTNTHMLAAADRGMRVDSQVAREVSELVQVCDSFLVNESGNRLKSLPHPVQRTLYHETSVGLQSPKSGIGYKGSLDYCYKSTEGEVILIDFKTYSATKSAKLPKKLREKYSRQLAAYALALKHSLGCVVDKAYLQVITFKDFKESETYSHEVDLKEYTPLWIEALEEYWMAMRMFNILPGVN